MPKKNDPHTIRASLVLAAIEEFGHQLGVIAEVQTEHGKKLEEIGEMKVKLNKLSDDMDVVKNILGKHSVTLNQHSKTLGEHSKIFSEHSRDLKLLKADMAFIKNDLVKFVQHEEIYVLEQRILALEKRT